MPLTHRQFLALSLFMEEEWNQPSRTDHYLMALRATIEAFAAGFSKNGKAPRFADMKLKFGKSDEAPKMTREEAAAISKARWFAATGYRPNKAQQNGKAGTPQKQG